MKKKKLFIFTSVELEPNNVFWFEHLKAEASGSLNLQTFHMWTSVCLFKISKGKFHFLYMKTKIWMFSCDFFLDGFLWE